MLFCDIDLSDRIVSQSFQYKWHISSQCIVERKAPCFVTTPQFCHNAWRCWRNTTDLMHNLRAPGFRSRGSRNHKGGHIFKIQYWMYAATGRPSATGPPLATALKGAVLMQLCNLWMYGAQIGVQEPVNQDFHFFHAIFAPPTKWRPWHVPCLPHSTYATDFYVTHGHNLHVELTLKTRRRTTVSVYWWVLEHYPWVYCTRWDVWRTLPSK